MRLKIILFITALVFVSCSKKSVSYYLESGDKYYNEGNLESAIKEYSKAIEIDPKNADSYYRRAIIYYEQNKSNLAIADYTTVIKINDKYPSAHCNRGFIFLYTHNRHDLAISDFKDEIKNNKNSFDAYYGLGLVYCEKDSFNISQDYLNTAIKKDSTIALAYICRGKTFFLQRNYKTAI